MGKRGEKRGTCLVKAGKRETSRKRREREREGRNTLFKAY